MNDNIDFNKIWKQQVVEEPDINALMEKLKGYKKTSRRKLLISNIMLAATSAFIIFIWYYYQPQFISSKIGIVLIILAMMMYIILYNRSLKTLSKTEGSQSNQEYLQELIHLKEKQKFMQSTVLSLYFILLSAGIALYLYEYTSRMALTGAVLTYGTTFIWIAFNWFYIRPKTIKKQQTKLDELIRRFTGLSEQLGDK
jgi:hypothetical protein